MSAELDFARKYLSAQSARLQANSPAWDGSVSSVTRSLREMESGGQWAKYKTVGGSTYGTTGGRVYSAKEYGRQVQRWAEARDEDLQRAKFDLIAVLAAPVARAYARHFLPFAESVISQWPVRTGYSRDEMFVSFDRRNDKAHASLNNAAPYAFYVKWGSRERMRGPKVREDWQRGITVKSIQLPNGKRFYYEPVTERSDGHKIGGNVWAEIARKPLRGLAVKIADDIERGI